MMAEWDGDHPTEGTIHAWIDGALDLDESTGVETHVAGCAECAARVAEARGLVAGASRIVGLLDEMPVATLRSEPPVRAESMATPGAPGSVWRMLRVTPARAAIAAGLIVVVGITLTRDRVAVEQTPSASDSTHAVVFHEPVASAPAAAPAGIAEPARPLTAATKAVSASAGAAAPIAPVPSQALVPVGELADAKRAATTPSPRQDTVLSAAIARRLAADQPARTLEPVQATSIPSAPASVGNIARMDTTSARKVLQERAESRLAAPSAAAATDRTSAKVASPVPADVGCYRIDALEQPTSAWTGVPLPIDVSLTSTPGAPDATGAPRYAIVPTTGGTQIGAWSRASGDTLSIVLQGASITTSGALVASGTAIFGTLHAMPGSRLPSAQFRPAAVGGVAMRVAAHRITCPR